MTFVRVYLFIIFLSLSIVMIIPGGVRRPVNCINSSIVEKIDRIGVKEVETIYNCALDKKTKFSPWFYGNLKEIQSRISALEQDLKGPIRPLQIQIRTDKKNIIAASKNQIAIDEENFITGTSFESLFIGYVIRQKNLARHQYHFTEAKVLTEFVMYLKGFEVSKSGSWPLVHPMLSAALIEAFESLPLRERLLVRKNISRIIEGSPTVSEMNVDNYPPPFTDEKLAVTEIATSISRGVAEAGVGIKRFIAYFAKDIRKRGYSQKATELYFDSLFITDRIYNENSEGFLALKKFSERNPQFRIAIKDPNRIWILPNIDPIDLVSLEGIHATKVVAERCGSFDFESLFEYSKVTEKIIVTDSCSKNRVYDIGAYFKGSVESFASANEKVSFVQFHLPSLMLKANKIPRSMDVIHMIQDRDRSSEVLQVLGWQEVILDTNNGFYSPKAVSDGIGAFRVF